MTESDIPSIVADMNEGGAIPVGVYPVHINKKRGVFSYIYFYGLGTYKVDESEPILIVSAEDSENIKNGVNE